MIVAATGHRPDKLPDRFTGYDRNNPLRTTIRQKIRFHLEHLRATGAISGMALGFDQDFAEVALELEIPLIAHVPFIGQETLWPETSQKYYRDLLAKAAKTVVVCEGGYASWKMLERNKRMVDDCEHLLACFDGSPGGTAHCVGYARKIGREMTVIDPRGDRRESSCRSFAPRIP